MGSAQLGLGPALGVVPHGGEVVLVDRGVHAQLEGARHLARARVRARVRVRLGLGLVHAQLEGAGHLARARIRVTVRVRGSGRVRVRVRATA